MTRQEKRKRINFFINEQKIGPFYKSIFSLLLRLMMENFIKSIYVSWCRGVDS